MVYVGIGLEVHDELLLFSSILRSMAGVINRGLDARTLITLITMVDAVTGYDDYYDLQICVLSRECGNGLDLLEYNEPPRLVYPDNILQLPEIIDDSLKGVIPLIINANSLFGRDHEHQINLTLLQVTGSQI